MTSNIIIKKNDTLKIKQMLKIELKSNTALITKSLLLNSCLHTPSGVQDIPEAYIHLIHIKQYYRLQYI
jgi:hypothetical protein